MRTIVRLMREVREPSGNGPGNGQYALQKALCARAPEWFRIGGVLQRQELPWWWCWKDRDAAVQCARENRPFVIGPNILFEDAKGPSIASERDLCQAASCVLQYTESIWYRDLIARHCTFPNRAPIVIWPYSIDPQPGEPLPAKYDLLIYVKSTRHERLVNWLLARYPRSVLFRYGSFGREALSVAARQSRACLYLSDSDRGPLGLAEILLAGCPAVGIAHGAPWIIDGQNGYQVPHFGCQALSTAIGRSQALDRQAVRAVALRQFDTRQIADTIFSSLQEAVGRIRRWGIRRLRTIRS